MLRHEVISSDTLENRNAIRWSEVNKRPYWFIWESKNKGVIKVSPYAECYSLNSLFLTTMFWLLNSLDFFRYPLFILAFYLWLVIFFSRKEVSLLKISDCNWYFLQHLLDIWSWTSSCPISFTIFCVLLERIGNLNLKPGGTSLRSQHRVET